MSRETCRRRAKELLGQMALREKVGQLNQRLYGFDCYTRDGEEIIFGHEFQEEVEKYGGLGALYGLYRADPWSGRDYETGLYGKTAIKAYNQMQRYVLEHSRLKIPALLSSECPHGHQALDGYLLPVNLCMGASFHPELIYAAYRVCGRQLWDMGVNLALVSLLDVARDPRWGRSEECFSEDPFLCACMAGQVVNAIQAEGVSVVAKHFAAQGECTGGINASAARIGERELREIHLPPMKACCEAGVDGVMAAYNEIDGIFCHANRRLLTDILRGELGFEGVVMADGCAIDQLDVVTGDTVRSGAAAIHAGVDIGLWDMAYGKLEEAIDRGYITEEEVDTAALRVLELKLRSGLFEHPFLEEDQELRCYTMENYPEALDIAREAVVLLENRGDVLPLSKEMRQIAVIGPNGDELYHQLGDYSPPVKRECCATVLDGVRDCLGGGACRVVYAKGCGILDGTAQEQEEAAALARESDVVVLVLGGSSSRFGHVTFDLNGAAISEYGKSTPACADLEGGGASMDCGEGVDAADVALPMVQKELAKRLFAAGKKVITVVIGGRAYALGEIAEESDALLYAFYPGMQGGKAIAEILFGDVNPSGRLPVSLPRHSGQIPVYYNYKNSYRGMHYYDSKDRAAYSFGDGKGYSHFEYEDITLEELGEKGFQLNMTIRNTGNYDGYAVPLLYISGKRGSVVRRIKELKAFQKTWIAKGKKGKVSLLLSMESFSVWNAQMEYKTEPGEVQLMLEESGEKVWSTAIEIGGMHHEEINT